MYSVKERCVTFITDLGHCFGRGYRSSGRSDLDLVYNRLAGWGAIGSGRPNAGLQAKQKAQLKMTDRSRRGRLGSGS